MRKLVCLLGLFFGVLGATSFTSEPTTSDQSTTDGEITIVETTESVSSEEETSETPIVSEDITTPSTNEPVEPTEPDIYVDNDGNGIPDVMEEWWNANISKTITLNTIVSVALQVISILVLILPYVKKLKQFNKDTNFIKNINTQVSKELKEQENKFAELIEKYKNQLETAINQNDIIERLENELTTLKQKLSSTLSHMKTQETAIYELVKRISNVDQFQATLNKILEEEHKILKNNSTAIQNGDVE